MWDAARGILPTGMVCSAMINLATYTGDIGNGSLPTITVAELLVVGRFRSTAFV